MNLAWLRSIKSASRQEPLTSFAIAVGAVDAVIGGVENSGSLFSFGLLTVGAAIALRWWILQRSRPTEPEKVAEHYLPPSSSRPQLPLLIPTKKRR